MRILGIDPGLQTTGFGVLDVDGQQPGHVVSGTIRTTALALGVVSRQILPVAGTTGGPQRGVAPPRHSGGYWLPDAPCAATRQRHHQPTIQA